MRRVKRLLAVAVLAAALFSVVGPMQPASADHRSSCELYYLCVWWNSSWNGAPPLTAYHYKFAGNNPSWAEWSINNDDSSSYSRGTSGRVAIIHTGYTYSGTSVVCLAPGGSKSQHNPNDAGSSNDWPWNCY